MGLLEYTDHGLFAPSKIAAEFRTTSGEVARSAGLGRDAVQRKERLRSDKTQRRLREMIEVINKAAARFGSNLIAYVGGMQPCPRIRDGGVQSINGKADTHISAFLTISN